MYEYLLDNGMTRDGVPLVRSTHRVKADCIMGTDYYVTNEHLVHADGDHVGAGEIFGYYMITQQYFDRYRLPVMHTETNIAEPRAAPLAVEGVGEHGAPASRTACRSSASPGTA